MISYEIQDISGNVLDSGTINNRPTSDAPSSSDSGSTVIVEDTEREGLKIRFLNGMIPTQEDFAALIDTLALRSELPEGSISPSGEIVIPSITTMDIINITNS